MKRFAQLFQELDRTTKTAEKVRALVEYFQATPAADAAWGLYFLTGNRIKRAVGTGKLREWAAELAGLPVWLVEDCYDAAGDLAETLSLIVPAAAESSEESLTEFVTRRVLPLPNLTEEEQKLLCFETWRSLPPAQGFLWLKLITGEFRVGVAKTLVIRALAQAANLDAAVMAHRVMGHWTPTAEFYEQLLQPEMSDDATRPFPFFLAHPLTTPLVELGPREDWQVEWKWDGIRAQVLFRDGRWSIWSRGEELVTERFPELESLTGVLPAGTVLDGEVLAFRDEQPLPFAAMQTRIGRKNLSAKILASTPVVFMAFDLLELRGEDLRERPLRERRGLLQTLADSVPPAVPFRISPLVRGPSWEEIESQYRSARERAVEGLMLKRREGAYGVGRPRGEWWKLKTEPYSIDAVLIYAQKGQGRRASLFSDYTFALWKDGELIPMAKAYSGLTDDEMQQVDSFVRKNTLQRFGPVHTVRPELVFELHFEGIQRSARHKSGVAVRFPRMARWRQDKKPEDANQLDDLVRLLDAPGLPAAGPEPTPKT